MTVEIPSWLKRGKLVKDIEARSGDARYILEGEEFDWTWIEVEIPFRLLRRSFESLPEKGEDKREKGIQEWMEREGGPKRALEKSPILAKWSNGKLLLLDGYHRIRVVQKLGDNRGTVIVGIEKGFDRAAIARKLVLVAREIVAGS
jgi:hypothetical protein